MRDRARTQRRKYSHVNVKMFIACTCKMIRTSLTSACHCKKIVFTKIIFKVILRRHACFRHLVLFSLLHARISFFLIRVFFLFLVKNELSLPNKHTIYPKNLFIFSNASITIIIHVHACLIVIRWPSCCTSLIIVLM
jgi:hypothetical protein